MELLKQQIQALIFCSEQSISLDEIASSLKLSFDWDVKDEEILAAIEEIKEQFLSDDFSFELVEISEGFQFLTKKQYYPAVNALIQHKAKKKLSVSQMETLAIIAYRQPIAKSEVEHIRGVSCDYAIQKLLEKELVEISGKSNGPGRPVLYSTSRSFMDYFGIKSVKDLPQLKDLHVDQNEIGNPADSLSDNEPETEVIREMHVESEIENDQVTHEGEELDVRDLPVEEEIESKAGTEEVSSVSDYEITAEDETTVFLTELGEIDDKGEPVPDLDTNESLSVNEFEEDELSIPDRKSIFLENEAREFKAEEEENRDEQ